MACVSGVNAARGLAILVCFSAPMPTAVHADAYGDAVELYESGDYRPALDALIPLAENGNVQAQLKLGGMYFTGTGTVRIPRTAAKFYRMASQQGDPEGQYHYANMLLDGIGVEQDESAGFDLMLAAAKAGLPAAQYRMAELYWNGKAFKLGKTEPVGMRGTAIEWLKNAVAAEYAPAMVMMGRAYSNGSGKYLAVDKAEALRLFQRASELGNSDATFALALAYATGEGAEQDAERAMEAYKAAAEGGNAEAQAHLGQIFELGIGVRADAALSFFWFEKAGKQGHPTSMSKVGLAYEFGKGVEQDYDKARFWYNKAYKAGDPDGLARLALLYYEGKGVPQEAHRAQSFLTMAQQQGSVLAQTVLTRLRKERERNAAASQATQERLLKMLFAAGVALASAPPRQQQISEFERNQRRIQENMNRTWVNVGTAMLLAK